MHGSFALVSYEQTENVQGSNMPVQVNNLPPCRLPRIESNLCIALGPQHLAVAPAARGVAVGLKYHRNASLDVAFQLRAEVESGSDVVFPPNVCEQIRAEEGWARAIFLISESFRSSSKRASRSVTGRFDCLRDADSGRMTSELA
jgi:hypothetical protein